MRVPAAYWQYMETYGREIGLATVLRKRRELVAAVLAESAANAALDAASAILDLPEAAEHEADQLTANGFTELFDGVSAKTVQHSTRAA